MTQLIRGLARDPLALMLVLAIAFCAILLAVELGGRIAEWISREPRHRGEHRRH